MAWVLVLRTLTWIRFPAFLGILRKVSMGFSVQSGFRGVQDSQRESWNFVWVLSWAGYRMKWDLRICLSFGPFWKSERRLLHIIPVLLHDHCCLHTQLESLSYLQSEERAYPDPDLGLTNSERKDYSRPQGSFTLLSLAWSLLLLPAFWSPVCPFLEIKVTSFFILTSHF